MGGSNKIKVNMLLYNTIQMIHHRGGEPKQATNCWFNNYCFTYTGFHLGGKWGQGIHPPLPESHPLPLKLQVKSALQVLVDVVTSFIHR